MVFCKYILIARLPLPLLTMATVPNNIDTYDGGLKDYLAGLTASLQGSTELLGKVSAADGVRTIEISALRAENAILRTENNDLRRDNDCLQRKFRLAKAAIADSDSEPTLQTSTPCNHKYPATTDPSQSSFNLNETPAIPSILRTSPPEETTTGDVQSLSEGSNNMPNLATTPSGFEQNIVNFCPVEKSKIEV